jgi:putative membrane protein
MTDARKPAVFRLEEDKPTETGKAKSRAVVIAPEPDVFAPPSVVPTDLPPQPRARARSISIWSKMFFSALTGLIGLAISLWFWRLVEELFRTSVIAGWVGVALVAMLAIALLALVIRETRGLMRLSAAATIREEADAAHAADDGVAARRVVDKLMAWQAADATTASARAAMASHMTEIIDGKALLAIADRTLLADKDERAKQAIASAAKRVSMVTAISPRAVVDVLFVAAQSIMLMRRVAEIYGARPGGLGFWRLSRRILSHLAITGGVAITDSVLSQLVGHGLAARLSAKLGEGVLNGLLTARMGLACIAACRPLPFLATEEPKLQDVAGEILSDPLGKKANPAG